MALYDTEIEGTVSGIATDGAGAKMGANSEHRSRSLSSERATVNQ